MKLRFIIGSHYRRFSVFIGGSEDWGGFTFRTGKHTWSNFHFKDFLGLTGVNWEIRRLYFLRSWTEVFPAFISSFRSYPKNQ